MRKISYNKLYILLAVIFTVIFALIAVLVKMGATQVFDSYVYEVFASVHSDTLTSICRLVSEIGNTIPIVFLCIMLLIIPKTRWSYGIYVSFTMSFSAALNILMKNIFMRTRPDVLHLVEETSYSFPSGHSMNNMALCVILLLLTVYMYSNRKSEIIAGCVLILFAVIIGLSRIYLGVHYASDVLAGFFIGAAWSLCSFLIAGYVRLVLKL